MSTHVEHVMGMAVSIDVRGDQETASVRALAEEPISWLHWVDATFSTYKPDSAISRVRRGELAVDDAPVVVRQVLARCDSLRQETGGSFDAGSGPTLDPSGYVKGWAVDVASDLLVESGAPDHCINAGGDVRLRGRPRPGEDWQVAIAHPLVVDAACAILHLGEGAVATSGISERGAHVRVPRTGAAALALASVTVVGPDLATTDAYATAALVLGMDAPAWLSQLAGFESLVVDAAGMVWQSDGLPIVAEALRPSA
jgi:thiamine biosynthesis lipoprotein